MNFFANLATEQLASVKRNSLRRVTFFGKPYVVSFSDFTQGGATASVLQVNLAPCPSHITAADAECQALIDSISPTFHPVVR
jgi:hypothetical protein